MVELRVDKAPQADRRSGRAGWAGGQAGGECDDAEWVAVRLVVEKAGSPSRTTAGLAAIGPVARVSGGSCWAGLVAGGGIIRIWRLRNDVITVPSHTKKDNLKAVPAPCTASTTTRPLHAQDKRPPDTGH